MEIQEWTAENSQRSYPFKQPLAGSTLGLPLDFLVDLRIFIAGNQALDVILSSVSYSSSTDTYLLAFATQKDPTVTVLSGTVTRRLGPISRIWKQSSIGSGSSFCLFTPGPSWDTPSFHSSGDWIISVSAKLEDGTVLPGPETLQEIRIMGKDRPMGGGKFIQLYAGYNCQISQTQKLQKDQPGINFLLEAGEGLGAGQVPSNGLPLEIRTINGVSPDDNGNINLVPQDCLHSAVPLLSGLPVPNTLQLTSTCQPCCGCENYRNMSRAIARRSAKIKDLMNTLSQEYVTAVTQGNVYITQKNASNISRGLTSGNFNTTGLSIKSLDKWRFYIGGGSIPTSPIIQSTINFGSVSRFMSGSNLAYLVILSPLSNYGTVKVTAITAPSAFTITTLVTYETPDFITPSLPITLVSDSTLQIKVGLFLGATSPLGDYSGTLIVTTDKGSGSIQIIANVTE